MSDRGADWYKREPRAFLEGVRKMSEREIAIYAVILDLIYDGGHQTLDDPKHIASYFSDLGTASVRRTIDHLVDVGKLVREGEFLSNKRAKNEGKTRKELTETRKNSGRLGGVSSGVSRSKASNNNGLSEANASSDVEPDKIREDIEGKEPNGSLSETEISDAPKSRKRKAYPEQFEQSWSLYPTDANMSKAKTFDAWKRLDEGDRHLLIRSIPAFKAYCRKNPDYRPVHMVRYITDRRFEGHAGEISGASDADWSKRLSAARQKKLWTTAEWGPMPGVVGCGVPRHLIEQGDGVGWREWTQDAA